MEESRLYGLFVAHPTITTDSRNCPAGSIFFALKGDKFDGNSYAQKALDAGCAYAVVDDAQYVPEGDERYILVGNVLQTLQQLARIHREHFHHPVLQITGTNGKTTTKELVAAVLAEKYRVLATEANYNNHIGVPKTLLRLKPENDFAVIETGANHPGEIKALAEITEPDCGLITNVGRAHLAGFGSFEGVIRTKGELYDYLRKKPGGLVFIHGDNPYLNAISSGLQLVKYGKPGHGDYFVEGEATECSPYLSYRWRKVGESEWHGSATHLIGAYNVDNVLAAVCVGTYFGVAPELIDRAIGGYVPKNDRSELRRTENNTLIVDAYNANPTSMEAALRNFIAMDGIHKMAVLGDMKELGEASEEEHQKIVDLLGQGSVETVWLVGENFRKTKNGFRTFGTVEEVEAELRNHPIKGRHILIKGSNGTGLFRLPDFL